MGRMFESLRGWISTRTRLELVLFLLLFLFLLAVSCLAWWRFSYDHDLEAEAWHFAETAEDIWLAPSCQKLRSDGVFSGMGGASDWLTSLCTCGSFDTSTEACLCLRQVGTSPSGWMARIASACSKRLEEQFAQWYRTK